MFTKMLISIFVDNLPSLPSRLTLSPLENDNSLRYKYQKDKYF